MGGFDSKKLIGFSGRSLRFSFNGKERFYSGEFSTPSQIFVNSNIANIETIIRPGDTIEIIPAIDGTSPIVRISDIAGSGTSGYVCFNGIKVDFGTKYLVNNIEVKDDYIIGNSDSIDIMYVKTIRDLIQIYEMDENSYTYFANGKNVDIDFELYNNCNIDVSKVCELTESEPLKEEAAITINEVDCSINVIINDKHVKLPKREDNTPYIFVDMLNYTDIDPSNPRGNIVLLHNGNEASYLNLISENDVIIIKWDYDII